MDIYYLLDKEHRDIVDAVTNLSDKTLILKEMEDFLYNKSEGKNLADEVMNMVNSMSDENMIWFVRRVGEKHRTLQQNFTRLMIL